MISKKPFGPLRENAPFSHKVQHIFQRLDHERPITVPLTVLLTAALAASAVIAPEVDAEIERDTLALRTATVHDGVAVESIASPVRGAGRERTVLATIVMAHCRIEDSRLVFGNGEGMDVTGYTITMPREGHDPLRVVMSDAQGLAESYPEFVANCK